MAFQFSQLPSQRNIRKSGIQYDVSTSLRRQGQVVCKRSQIRLLLKVVCRRYRKVSIDKRLEFRRPRSLLTWVLMKDKSGGELWNVRRDGFCSSFVLSFLTGVIPQLQYVVVVDVTESTACSLDPALVS